MQKWFFHPLIFILLNILLLSFYPKKREIISTGINVKELTSIDKEMKQFMTQWNIPGGTAALVRNGEIVYARGFGMADESNAVLPQSLFRIASLSKPITAVAIMQLIEKKKISPEQKVFGENGILNDKKFLKISDPRVKDITIQNLLEHTAGWDRDVSPCGDPMFDPVNIAKCMKEPSPASTETVIKFMLSKPLDFTPGTAYAYSNIGFAVLGRVIEKVSGLSYEEYVQKNIFAPLHIKDMHLGKNLFCNRRSNEVKYYDEENKEIPSVCSDGEKVPYPYGGFNLEAMDAHGGWIASAPDLAKFLTGIPKLLKKETIDFMLTPSSIYNGYAKGWFVNNRGSWWHSGCLVGTSTMMANVKGNISWVLLFNSNPNTDNYFEDLDRLMWRAMDGVEKWPGAKQL